MGQVTLAVMARPRPLAQRFLEADASTVTAARRTHPPGLLVGWHVRSGACSGLCSIGGRRNKQSRDALDLGRWDRWTMRLHSSPQGPVGTVLVASDAFNMTAGSLHHLFPNAPYKFVRLVRHEEGLGPENKTQAGMETLSDLSLLMRADAFLGTSSNWATLVMAAILAARPSTPSKHLCVVITASPAVPLGCLGEEVTHEVSRAGERTSTSR